MNLKAHQMPKHSTVIPNTQQLAVAIMEISRQIVHTKLQLQSNLPGMLACMFKCSDLQPCASLIHCILCSFQEHWWNV